MRADIGSCQLRQFVPQQMALLFDHLVGAGGKRERGPPPSDHDLAWCPATASLSKQTALLQWR
jgi:hypothetical protein